MEQAEGDDPVIFKVVIIPWLARAFEDPGVNPKASTAVALPAEFPSGAR